MSPEIRNLLDLLWPGLAAGGAAGALLPWLRRDWLVARVVMLSVGAALILRYVTWRGLETVPPIGPNLDFLIGIVFYLIETVALLGAILNALFLSRTRNRSSEADRGAGWLASQHPAPFVDVLARKFQRVYHRAMNGWQIGQRAAQPGFLFFVWGHRSFGLIG